ncbi:hypothetical protein GCU56_14290 [Geodermatophilus sabuli]|uniref:Uncharacterized protein n=1 Tax=Geodermatophilus sabuli TaxID=1564158 RepID=A0A7K3W5C9_9ACTN|nr:hypothetical protein [Geodermatophilus sabuli]NEK59037.1 hypothetical protein [Geodermatophilus sabuli]
MFVLVLVVPALLVVVLGYVVGYALWEWAGGGALLTPEVPGWTAGLVLLAVVLRIAVRRLRRR